MSPATTIRQQTLEGTELAQSNHARGAITGTHFGEGAAGLPLHLNVEGGMIHGFAAGQIKPPQQGRGAPVAGGPRRAGQMAKLIMVKGRDGITAFGVGGRDKNTYQKKQRCKRANRRNHGKMVTKR